MTMLSISGGEKYNAEGENMDWIELDSGNLYAISHDGVNLFVTFKNMKTYYYPNVPVSTMHRIISKECSSKSTGEPSSGATFDQLVIKQGYVGIPI